MLRSYQYRKNKGNRCHHVDHIYMDELVVTLTNIFNQFLKYFLKFKIQIKHQLLHELYLEVGWKVKKFKIINFE